MVDYPLPAVNCQSVLKLPECKYMKLIAGESGLHHYISWVHYIEEESYIRFVKGKELILTTGILLRSKEDYLNFIENLYKKNVSGVVINEQPTGGIPYCDDIVALGNQLELPIFSLPFYCRFEDITQSICHEIFLCEQQSRGKESVLFDLFFGSAEEVRVAGSSLNKYGFDFSRPLICSVLRTNNVPLLSDPSVSASIKCYFEYCQEYFRREIIFTQHSSEIAMLFPVDPTEQKEMIYHILFTMRTEISNLLESSPVYIGVSSIWKGQDALAVNLTNARFMAALCASTGHDIMDYDESGSFKLLLSLDKKSDLEQYYSAAIKPLLESDRVHGTEYVSTLLAYLKNNCNLQETANNLFIHYNTLRYRLRAIEKLLSKDFRISHDLSDVMLLWDIKQYLDCDGLI